MKREWSLTSERDFYTGLKRVLQSLNNSGRVILDDPDQDGFLFFKVSIPVIFLERVLCFCRLSLANQGF